MKIIAQPFKDCYVLQPKVFKDDRGSFFESFNKNTFEEVINRKMDFVQDNQSISAYGTVRGLHMQTGKYRQAKLIRVVQGEIYDVCVDLRQDSPDHGKHFGIKLNAENNYQMLIPRGFAHGFSVLSETAICVYKCDNFYDKASEVGFYHADEHLGIDWIVPENKRIISEKDQQQPLLKDTAFWKEY